MGLATIMLHLTKASKDLSYRSLSNLEGQKVTPFELARACEKQGWRCMQAGDRVWIAKNDDGFAEFEEEQAGEKYWDL